MKNFFGKWGAFVLGYLACIGTRMYNQDKIGLEACIQQMKDHWVDLDPLVGLTVAFVATMTCVLFVEK